MIQFPDGQAQDSREGLKSGEGTRVIIESGSRIESPSWGSGSYSSQVQFQEKDNLPKCQCGFQNLEFGQVQMGVLKWNLVFQNNMILWL